MSTWAERKHVIHGDQRNCTTANPVLTGTRIWALWILYFAVLPIRLCTAIMALVAGANGLHFKHRIPGHHSSVKQAARMTSSGSPLGTLGLPGKACSGCTFKVPVTNYWCFILWDREDDR